MRLILRLVSSLPLLNSFHHAAPICDNGGIKVESITRPATSHRSANERRKERWCQSGYSTWWFSIAFLRLSQM